MHIDTGFPNKHGNNCSLIRMGKWMAVPSLASRRSSCGVTAQDGYLYCVGGNDGTMCLGKHEYFHISIHGGN